MIQLLLMLKDSHEFLLKNIILWFFLILILLRKFLKFLSKNSIISFNKEVASYQLKF